MRTDIIKVPDQGTYQSQLFSYWSDEFRQTHADHSAYIALNFAGVLDACRSKLADKNVADRHIRAIARLQNTMTGAAMSYESCFRRH